MRGKNKKKRIKLKKKSKKKVQKLHTIRKKSKITKSKKIRTHYPYIVRIAAYKKNTFFTVADMRGRIKMWTNPALSGYTKQLGKIRFSKNIKIETMEKFLTKIWMFGVRTCILNFYAFRWNIRSFLKEFRKIYKKYKFKYIYVKREIHNAFNGCQAPKRKRKKRRLWKRRRR